LLTVGAEAAFAAVSAVLLVVAYLVYATPPQWTLYYFESVPTLAYLSAAGLAWAASLALRPGTEPPAASFNWRSPRLARPLVIGALGLALPGLISLRIIHGQHIGDRKFLTRFDALLESIHDQRAVVFVRYAGSHNPHVSFVRNVANPDAERIWVVYDRGDAENAKFLAAAPGRASYLFDELRGKTFVYDPTAP
jgi:hypothetical protein